jgi:hypothetical protein
MAVMPEEEIDRLKSRLQWEAQPLADLSNQGLNALFRGLGVLAARLREGTKERPLTSLLLAFEIGFAAGRWGPRRAQH